MSQKQRLITFAQSFVEHCYDSGMTKQGAALLLDKHLLDGAMEDPDFHAGFVKVAYAGSPGYYSARQWSVGDEPGQNTAAYGAAGAGAGAYLGQRMAKAFKGGFGKRLKWGGRLGAVGALGGALLGAKKDADIFRSRAVGQTGGVPVTGPWDQKAEQDGYDAAYGRLSGGVADLNRRYNENSTRMAELRQAVDNNAPGAAQALAEYQRRREDTSSLERSNYFNRLGGSQERLEKELNGLRGQQDDLHRSRGSFWGRSRDRISRMFGGRPYDYDGEALRLKAEEERMANELRMTQGLQRRLLGGYTGGDPSQVLSQDDLEARMFPTR
jgi:hypothetical protein